MGSARRDLRVGAAFDGVSLAPPRPRPKADRDRCGLQRKRRNGCQIPPIVEPSLRFFVTLSVSPRRRPLYVDEAGLGALTSFLVSGSVSLAGSCSGPKRPQAGSGLALIGFFAFSFVAPGPLFLFFCNALIFHLESSVFLTLPSLLFLRFFFLLVRSFSDEAASTGLAGSVVWARRTCCRGPLCAV